MSDLNQKKQADEETIALNLARFAPGQKPSTPAPAEEESITLIVERAAADVAKKNTVSPPSSAPGAPAAPTPPKEMLGAVAYSYAKGVYRSEDIARKMENDPGYSAAAGERLPDAQAIRRFRRLNRSAIMETLAQVFRRKRKKESAETLAQTMPGAEPAATNPSNKADNEPGETTILSRRDAENKLNNAAWIDNMSKDD